MIDVSVLAAWVGASTSDYGMLEELEAQVVAQIERETGRYFGAVEEVTEILDGSGINRLWLSEVPVEVLSVLTVTVTEVTPVGDETVITDYTVRSDGFEGWLERDDALEWNSRYKYHVTYDRGYEEDAAPADIRGLVMSEVSRVWAGQGREGLASETIGPYSYTVSRSTDTDPAAMERERIIRRWRRTAIA